MKRSQSVFSVTLQSKEFGSETIKYTTRQQALQAIDSIRRGVILANDGIRRTVVLSERLTIGGSGGFSSPCTIHKDHSSKVSAQSVNNSGHKHEQRKVANK